MKIPLFDIDWTLLEGGGDAFKPHYNAYDYVFKTVYNIPDASISDIVPDGMIETQIIVEILKLHGISEELTKARMKAAVKAMENYFLAHEGEGRYIALPGVKDILAELKKKCIPLGILSGNIESIGWRKVARAGLQEFFDFGSFGDLAYKRVDLVPIAAEKAREQYHMKIPLIDFVLVGDTPLDVACAKAAGVQVIAVASGKFSSEELCDTGADLVVTSLREQQKVLEFLSVL